MGHLRAVPLFVWLVTALFGLLLLCWSLLAPLARTPDEQAHADLVFLMATGASYPDFGERFMAEGVLSAFFNHTPGFESPETGTVVLTAEAAPERGDRRTLREWGGMESVDFHNQMTQHPPLYYWSLGTILRGERWLLGSGGRAPLDREWHQLRLLNVLIVLPLPVLAWAGARRLGATDAVASTAALVPLCIPQLAHIGSSINNDNLLVLFAGVVAVLTARVLRGNATRTVFVGLGLALGMALFAKQFALVLLPWVALAVVYSTWRGGRRWRDAAVALALVGVPTAVVGGAWPLRNLVRNGELLPSAADGPYYRSKRPGHEVDVIDYVGDYTASMVQGFWGDFGWHEVPLPPALLIVASALAVVAAIAALTSRDPATPERRAPGGLGSRRFYAAVIPLSFVVLIASDFERYRLSGQHAFMQGRYLFSAIVPFAVVVGWGAYRLLRRRAPATLVLVAGGMHLAGALVCLRAWWAEPDASVLRSVSSLVAWSPWPPPVLWALAVATAGVGAWVLVSAGRSSWAECDGGQLSEVPTASGTDMATSGSTGAMR